MNTNPEEIAEVVTDVIDYSSQLAVTNELLYYIAGMLLFVVIVILGHYTYKFFKMFF